MAQYDPLRDYLVQSGARELTLKFKEISAIIGKELPKGRDRGQFWANDKAESRRSAVNQAVSEAGYRSFLLTGLDRVRFVRATPQPPAPRASASRR
jgi:hypothetical protein